MLMSKKLTAEEFIQRAKGVKEHKNKEYDYSKVNYINSHVPVIIICPKHGEFSQLPYTHLLGRGCPECAKEIRINKKTSCTEKFIEKAKIVHKDRKYDYSKSVYKRNETLITITCPIHGDFRQTPHSHLLGRGCPKCAKERIREKELSCISEFIYKAKNIPEHNKRGYDYSKAVYQGNKIPVCIICPKHGEFWQTPHDHLGGHGCPKCAQEIKSKKRTLCTEEFIYKAKTNGKHKNNMYIYSKTNYINNHTKVCIICPKHGEFWQMPYAHLNGQGCPKCKMSHLEQQTMSLLEKYHVRYETQKKFDWLLTPSNNKMPLDFYLPDYNIAIECQGIQHYFHKTNSFFTKEVVLDIRRRDRLKKQLCELHNIKLVYIKYSDNISMKMNEIMQYFQN